MVNVVYEAENKRAAAYDGENNIGESTYSASDGIWIIDHTFVEPSYGGQGIATKLVATLVDEARKQEKKIIPLCVFAKKEFARREEYADVLAK